MAKKFEFASVTTELEIAGRVFHVDCNSDRVVTALEKFADRCDVLGKQGNRAAFEQGMPAMEKLLENVLGQGACEEIFAARAKNWNDLYDLSMFVCESISEARDAHSEKHIQNREQRRGGRPRKRRHR